MTKFRVYGKFLLPVYTIVEAESEEEATRIARTRTIGDDSSTEWLLDETEFLNPDLN